MLDELNCATLLGMRSLNLSEELKYNILCLRSILQRLVFKITFVIPGASSVVASEEPQKYLSVLGRCPRTHAESLRD